VSHSVATAAKCPDRDLIHFRKNKLHVCYKKFLTAAGCSKFVSQTLNNYTMKKTHFRVYPATALCLLLFSCGSTELQMPMMAENKIPASNEGTITFKVDDALVKTSGWNISRYDMGDGIKMNITTNMHQDKRTVAFNINGCSVGRYSLKSGSRGPATAYGDYKPDYSNMLNSYSFQDGEFVIEEIDTVKGTLNATFFGTVKRGEETFSISEGSIIGGKMVKAITRYQ
jgi:hypothetical protein